MSEPPYTQESAFYGSVTLAVIYLALCETGADPDYACLVLTAIIAAGDLTTRPALAIPFTLCPNPNGRTIAIKIGEKVSGYEVWIQAAAAEPRAAPRVRQKPGIKEYDAWKPAMLDWWKLCLQAKADGLPTPDPVMTIRGFCERHNLPRPHRDTIVRKVKDWPAPPARQPEELVLRLVRTMKSCRDPVARRDLQAIIESLTDDRPWE